MMLPADLSPRSFLGADAISYSELSTLAACEKKWLYSYGSERVESQPSAAMRLGSEVHRLWGQYHTDQPYLNTEDDTARWLMERYAEYYDCGFDTLAIEPPLVARLPWGPYFFGFADGLIRVNGNLHIAELKTAKDFSSIRHLIQSPQGPLYVWAARQMGLPVQGVLLDVICTAGHDAKETKAEAYKRLRADGVSVAEAKKRSATERETKAPMPLADSFQRRWLTWTDDEIKQVVREAHRALAVRLDLTVGGATPLRNIGPACGWCPHIAPCHGLELEILEEDDF